MAWTSVWLTSLLMAAKSAIAKPPNILFILTDDQDWHMESMQHMPYLQKHLINEGTVYANHFCTVALCCPSRVNMWTGRAAHNTNVTDVSLTTETILLFLLTQITGIPSVW
jgi:N-acetylglucosamine-6-sulfatase